jgi:hypothetical protein
LAYTVSRYRRLRSSIAALILIGAGSAPAFAQQPEASASLVFNRDRGPRGRLARAIRAGKVADLVLLDADPLADITDTTKIRAVVANGRYFDRTALDKLERGEQRP